MGRRRRRRVRRVAAQHHHPRPRHPPERRPPRLRSTLLTTPMFGIDIARYVLRLQPLASTDPDTLVPTIAPNLQRYLTGDLD
ncbi:hypothetical protein [Actinosynnema sp. NPDC023587]|uniref:TetR/AcrR family transcriptional regulator n=1 Tax=Actinosynnema sp. NPDC023587 TaxID=3154695 RepID=UPI0033C36CE7